MAVQRVGPFERDAAIAGVDLSDKLFCAVSRNTSGELVLTAAGETPAGFVIETAPLGRPASYATRNANIANGLAGGAIAIGDELEVGADGKVVKATTAGDGFGFARNAGAANAVIEVTFK